MKYQRILLKLSGESLQNNGKDTIDPFILNQYADEIATAYQQGVQIAIVVGGGNIFRGWQGSSKGMDRVQGDYMGMLATVINSMAIQGALQAKGLKAKIFGGLEINPVAEKMSKFKAIEALNAGYIIIISGGTGNPYFTTDSAAALRGIEIEADILLKGTRVDGVYTADPEKDPSATKYSQVSFDEAYKKGLKIMDLTAFTLCRENHLPIYVFDMNQKDNLSKVIRGEEIGTLVSL
ncbi:MAG: UMP kinase [Bacteroidales bacterium]|nr:UMP kinase [Bacteroidales bacterium]